MESPLKGGSTLAMAVSGSPMHVRNRGIGQDFVLFDDERQQSSQPSVLMPSRSNDAESSSSINPSFTMTSRPSFDTKPSFTEYRATPQSATQNESPFSSPASKPDDDFVGSDQGHGMDVYYSDRGSGTLDHGTPKSKRQRGHGYSSSWTGGNLQQHRHQIRGQPSGGTLATAMDPSHSFGGYNSNNLKQSDWNGSDTSPQIHSLSLGDGNDGAGSISSLFPAAAKPLNDQSMQPNSGMTSFPTAFQTPPSGPFPLSSTSQQQEQRAREQIRNELMGVDSRALKGPLRDIQQGMGQDGNQNLYANFDFGAFQSNAFFPGDQSRIRPPGIIRQRSGSLDTTFLSTNPNYSNENYDASQMNWNGTLSNDINAFDLQGLDDHRLQRQQQPPINQSQRQSHVSQSSSPPNRPDMQDRQFSVRTQQIVDRARAQKPTRKRMSQDGSGLTISPQEAFLDYNDIESLIQASRSLTQGQYSNTAQNLFAPPPPGIEDVLHSDSHVMTPKPVSYQGTGTQYNPHSSLASAHEGTPSLVDASSNSSNGSRATSVISSPLQRLPLNREDTVRPSKSQLALLTQQGNNTGNLFSPAYSTSSSTDDEDEKPYEQNNQQLHPPRWQFPFPAQSNHASASNQASHSGPRFSVVSSSSSESEDDDQRGRGGSNTYVHPQGRRMMGGYGYMGSSQESGLNASTSSLSWQQPVQSIQQQQQRQHYQQQQQHLPHPLLTNSNHSFSPPATNAQSIGIMKGSDRTPQSAGGQSDSQSQDDAPSLSPSIRSSAQAIPQADSRQSTNANAANHAVPQNQVRQRSRSRNRAQGVAAAAAASHIAPATTNNRRTSEAETSGSSFDETSEWETGEESEADGSDYNDVRGTASNGPKNTTRKRRRGAATIRQGGGAANSASSASHLTVCDYVSPLTGESCKTEFHRPYDLARHRETIHAREEATLIKQGRLKKEQCVVLYKEVDPAKSLATVEWKCEGRNGCGSLFSRKDALLRHKRIRGH